jgi:hypothetical protein
MIFKVFINCHCIENDIIKLETIKYVIKSSLSLQNHFHKIFIDYCQENIENHKNIAITSMIAIAQNNYRHK